MIHNKRINCIIPAEDSIFLAIILGRLKFNLSIILLTDSEPHIALFFCANKRGRIARILVAPPMIKYQYGSIIKIVLLSLKAPIPDEKNISVNARYPPRASHNSPEAEHKFLHLAMFPSTQSNIPHMKKQNQPIIRTIIALPKPIKQNPRREQIMDNNVTIDGEMSVFSNGFVNGMDNSLPI